MSGEGADSRLEIDSKQWGSYPGRIENFRREGGGLDKTFKDTF